MAAGANRNQVILHHYSASRWLSFRNPYKIIEAAKIEDVVPALDYIEDQLAEGGRYAAGFISYEASGAFDPALCTKQPGNFPLLWFGLYPPPVETKLPDPDFQSYSMGDRIPTVTRDEYNQAISRIKHHIHSGDTYQVNYTFQLKLPFSGDPWNLFLAMVRAQSPGYAAWIDAGRYAICSASPELFFRLEGDRLICKPMKGTVKRGRTLGEDKDLSVWLQKSEKNRAENLMIVDMIRNDLGRIAVPGSVQVEKLFEVERHPTLWQMTSTVHADSRKSLSEILSALFPCASITGAPKIRTARIIADLEKAPRNLYTGCIGFLGPDSSAQFNVAIRTAVVDRHAGTAEYGTGGGIVWDSVSGDEYTEAILKSRVLSEQRPDFSLLETLLWTPEEGYFLKDYHLRRLSDSASYFGYKIAIDNIDKALGEKASAFRMEPYRVRLTADRDGTVNLDSSPLGIGGFADRVRVGLARDPVNSRDIFLYHKTTCRNVYDEALRLRPECEDILLWNEKSELTESSIANIVLEIDGKLVTPPVASGLLAGVFREWLIDKGTILERVLSVHDLKRASTIYLVNSVRKWRKAALVDDEGS